MFAIRSEYYFFNRCYGYAGKPESPMHHLSWYATPLDATHYKSKVSAQRRAKHYQNLDIKCRVVEIQENLEQSGWYRFEDMELKAREQAYIDLYAG